MLWVIKRNVSMRASSSFEHPKHMFKLMNKKIVAILRKIYFLKWPYEIGRFCENFDFFFLLNLVPKRFNRPQQYT